MPSAPDHVSDHVYVVAVRDAAVAVFAAPCVASLGPGSAVGRFRAYRLRGSVATGCACSPRPSRHRPGLVHALVRQAQAVLADQLASGESGGARFFFVRGGASEVDKLFSPVKAHGPDSSASARRWGRDSRRLPVPPSRASGGCERPSVEHAVVIAVDLSKSDVLVVGPGCVQALRARARPRRSNLESRTDAHLTTSENPSACGPRMAHLAPEHSLRSGRSRQTL